MPTLIPASASRGIKRSASRAPHSSEQYEQRNDQYENHGAEIGAFLSLGFIASLARAFVFALRGGDHGLNASGYPCVEQTFFKIRRDFVLDDSLASDVRQRAFETVARLNSHFAVLQKHK